VLLEHDDGRQAIMHAALDTVGPNRAVAIMGTLNEVRSQIGLRYPGE
jgi:hypothetical protein